MWKLVNVEMKGPIDHVQYVLDGGALLQKIPWAKGMTYDAICDSYVEHIKKGYEGKVEIVFDGYRNIPSTKDQAHQRRWKQRCPN